MKITTHISATLVAIFSFFISCHAEEPVVRPPLTACQQLAREVTLACRHARRCNGDKDRVLGDLPTLFLAQHSIERMYAQHAQRQGVVPRLEVVDMAATPALAQLVNHCAHDLGITPPLVVLAHDSTFTTAVAAGVSEATAVLLLGTGLLERTEPAELTALLYHELAHIADDDIANTIFLRWLLIVLLALLCGGLLLLTMYLFDLLHWHGVAFTLLIGGSALFVVPRAPQIVAPVVDYYIRRSEIAADAQAHAHTTTEIMHSLFERLAQLQGEEQVSHARMYDDIVQFIKHEAAAWPWLESALIRHAETHRAQTDRAFAALYARHPSWQARHEALTASEK